MTRSPTRTSSMSSPVRLRQVVLRSQRSPEDPAFELLLVALPLINPEPSRTARAFGRLFGGALRGLGRRLPLFSVWRPVEVDFVNVGRALGLQALTDHAKCLVGIGRKWRPVGLGDFGSK